MNNNIKKVVYIYDCSDGQIAEFGEPKKFFFTFFKRGDSLKRIANMLGREVYETKDGMVVSDDPALLGPCANVPKDDYLICYDRDQILKLVLTVEEEEVYVPKAGEKKLFVRTINDDGSLTDEEEVLLLTIDNWDGNIERYLRMTEERSGTDDDFSVFSHKEIFDLTELDAEDWLVESVAIDELNTLDLVYYTRTVKE